MSTTRAVVRRGAYADSIRLLGVTAELKATLGVEEATAAMATELNVDLMRQAGLLVGEAESAGPNDLVIAVRASGPEAAEAALERAAQLLAQERHSGPAEEEAPRSIAGAVRRATGEPNVAVVSVPGAFAAGEAWQALRAGLHAFIFSDNVPLEDEVALKREAVRRDLLVMGPDCGTAILGGVGLGFANAVRRGRIGLVGASGTGIQEISTLLDRAGSGISHAIGTGGRDLHETVGGATTLQGLRLLAGDDATDVIVLVSKPPAPEVASRVLEAAAATGKPVVACLLGVGDRVEPPSGVVLAPTLFHAAWRADILARGTAAEGVWPAMPGATLGGQYRGRLRGLYCGGTLCEEADEALDSVPREMTDFGDDRYTRGRAHPMIDPSLRDQALADAARDPGVAVLLLDLVLGFGAHPDPAADLAPRIVEARRVATAAGRALPVCVHVLGTERDAQGLARQEQQLRDAGALLFPSNLHAASAAGALAGGAGT